MLWGGGVKTFENVIMFYHMAVLASSVITDFVSESYNHSFLSMHSEQETFKDVTIQFWLLV